jgi:exodeoxyribonuclease V beta subunit
LEELIPIEKIVLITFTKAAAEELKKNTSDKIREAYAIWKNGSCKKNDLTVIIENAKKENSQIKEASLLDAIARIDELPVFTIHGFCERLLSEFAFETGNFEEKEVVTNLDDVKERVIADFWRENVKNSDIETESFSPKDLSNSISAVLQHPHAVITGEDIGSINKSEKPIKYAIAYKLACEIREKLQAEKRKLKIIDFDDMINDCHDAVKKDSKKVLKNAVQKRYNAILVDEFQDTDRMQYEIFNYLFEGKPFFMIGDPKQAIYRFRGGDIFAYTKAREEAGGNQFSMLKNYRSEKTLLDALNVFFSNDSFKGKMGGQIEYFKVECGDTDIIPVKENKDSQYNPFVIWKGRNNENKGDFEAKAQMAVINEIKRLLKLKICQTKDIAILLDSNNDCLVYKNALAKENIYAIVSGGSVFSGEAAHFLRILLNAVCYNNKPNYIRGLLTHRFCGYEPEGINEEIFMRWANALYETKSVWEISGIMKAIDYFMAKLDLWKSIGKKPDRERNITNIRKITELLNEEETKYGKIPEKIKGRFASLCVDAEKNDETEEKLETDEEALKIMTIHKSKGLQFNFVFVPDVGRCPRPHSFPHVYMYHENGRQTLAYTAESKNNEKYLSEKEENEESARLLYVALTRAKLRLYVACSPCKRKTNGEISRAVGASSVCREIFDNTSLQNENFTVEDLDGIYENAICYSESRTEEKERKPPKQIPEGFLMMPAWQRTSFSEISRHLEYKEYIPVPQKTVIPAGKRMGILLHSIFENLDFNAGEKEIREIAESKLGGFKEFSGEDKYGEERMQWVVNQVNVILNKALPGNAGMLQKVEPNNKVTELDFFMKTENLNLGKIKELLNKNIYNFESNDFSAKYIKGIIDLIFLGGNGKYYILDWKSNNLNNYKKDEMEEAMLHHGYHLQYYIYAVALKRWLEKTHNNFNFKERFGGVYYIFIRGVKDEKENFDGIYFCDGKNIADSIEKLDKIFNGEA